MKTAMTVSDFLFVAAASLAGCGGGGTPEGTASPAAPLAQTKMGSPGAVGPVQAPAPGAGATSSTAKQHDIRGRVEAISRDHQMVTLDHEEIPGVMAAMKMEYGVADALLLDRLALGDRVEGRLEERTGTYVIVSLRKR